jgi:hypothetical protein
MLHILSGSHSTSEKIYNQIEGKHRVLGIIFLTNICMCFFQIDSPGEWVLYIRGVNYTCYFVLMELA